MVNYAVILAFILFFLTIIIICGFTFSVFVLTHNKKFEELQAISSENVITILSYVIVGIVVFLFFVPLIATLVRAKSPVEVTRESTKRYFIDYYHIFTVIVCFVATCMFFVQFTKMNQNLMK